MTLSFDKSGYVFYGRNGIGKTNLLEAICYLAYGKSFRVTSDTDLIKHNKDFLRIEGVFNFQNESFKFEAAINRKGEKLIKINNRRIDKISQLYQLLKIVFFSQDDINLINGSPKKRRHYFDLAVSQNNYKYLYQLRKYLQIVKQRNTLLKNNQYSQQKIAWDKQFIETATDVIELRIAYLEKINLELLNSKITDNESMAIKYKYSFKRNNKNSLIEEFSNELKQMEKEEYLYQRTLIGPHLDDYTLTLNNYNINKFGSHGQKRCFVILLGLAQAKLLTQLDKDSSIMIFDDVLSDLDDKRTKAIISLIRGISQIFIGTPNPELYKDLNLPLVDLEEL